jgi:hypothetical protein
MNAHTLETLPHPDTLPKEREKQTAPLVVVCLECRRATVKPDLRVPVNEHGWAHASHGYCPPCGAIKLAEVRALPVAKEAA